MSFPNRRSKWDPVSRTCQSCEPRHRLGGVTPARHWRITAWLIGAQQTDKPSLVPNMLVARLLESASPQAIAAKGRSNFQNWPKWRKGAGPTQTDGATRNDGLPPVASIPEHTVCGRMPLRSVCHAANTMRFQPLENGCHRRWLHGTGRFLAMHLFDQAAGKRASPPTASWEEANGHTGATSPFNSGALSLSANGRISSPVRQKTGKEASLGLALKRSGRVPVELLVERRVGLDRGAGMPLPRWSRLDLTIFRLPGELRLSRLCASWWLD